MSYKSYEEAITKILTFKHLTAGEQSDELLRLVEKN